MEAGIDRGASVRPALLLLATAAVVYVADQVTKALVVENLALGERIPVLGDVVQIWHVRNTGAAFSLLPGATWLFIPVTIVALGMIVWFYRSFRTRGAWLQILLGTILGGTLGNLTDRIRFGWVVDWISVGVGDLRWPTFNVADPSVVMGIGALVIYLTFFDSASRDERAA